MTEQEKLDFKKTERERVKKAMQQNRKKQKLNMTPEALIDHQKKEATRIRALRNKKKIITEQSTKEKAKAMLHIFSAKQKNPYKTRKSFSKAMNRLRCDLPGSPRKQTAVVQGLASEFGYHFKSKNTVPSEIKEKIEKFFYRTDIVYTMPGKGDEMTVWTDEGRKRLRKYYLTMYLKEAHALYLESCESDNDRCSFSSFCSFRPQNVLLLGDSPKHQCKCEIHENLLLKLEAMGILYEKSWWKTVLCDITPNRNCWKNVCSECIDGKNLVPNKSLVLTTSYKQWENIEVPCSSKTDENKNETYKKLTIVMKDVRVGEVLDDFMESFSQVKDHQNTKLIQAAEFQNDISDPTKRVL